ncbi:hypothetical protein DH2020_026060 [Rehmannia glutinosa]|uniref:Cyclin N-terminal domain-containing protein n=1 Tax=Rehmannia glutinosa TaxID=99300 RepID=A0ABR0W200_REHGL
MESLLCNEVWLMSPDVDDECNAKGHVASNSLFNSTKEDCEEALGIFLGKEARYMPEQGYMDLVKTNDFIHNARFKSINWLIKSQRRLDLSLGTVFLAVNYLDRFISLTQCQVENVDNFFAPNLIQRMELTVLKALGWRMDSVTPFCYVCLLIRRIDALNKTQLVDDFTKRVTELLLTALLAMCDGRVCREMRIQDLFSSTNNASIAHLDAVIPEDQKDDLINCQRIMGKLVCGNCWHGPSSPVTVLKLEWFSFYNYPLDHLSFLKTPG